MDKQEVIAEFIKLFQAKIESTRESLESTRACAIDAPGSNVSRSDTSKFQFSNLALGFERRLVETETMLRFWVMMADQLISKTIISGSLTRLKNLGTQEEGFFIIIGWEGGGDSVEISSVKVTSLSTKAPLGKVLLGKEEADEIEFQGKRFEVLEIQ